MHRRMTAISWALLLLLCGCRTLFQTPPDLVPEDGTPPQRALTEPCATITYVVGEIRVEPKDTDTSIRATPGHPLRHDAVIVASPDAVAEAVYNDGRAVRVASNERATIACDQSAKPPYRDIVRSMHRGHAEVRHAARPIPQAGHRPTVLLAPRNTRLLDPRPTIRWQPVDTVLEYTIVVVQVDGTELWQATIPRLELAYPQAEPPLEPGNSYHIHLLNRAAEDEVPLDRVWVAVCSDQERTEIQQFQTELAAQDLLPESKQLLLGVYYVGQRLYDLALPELIALAQETPSPLSHRLLGDVYLNAVQIEEARSSYRQAHRLAAEQGSQRIQAEAAVGLGHVAYSNQAYGDALEFYQEALALYDTLGLEDEANDVQALVAQAEAALPTPSP